LANSTYDNESRTLLHCKPELPSKDGETASQRADSSIRSRDVQRRHCNSL